jgi:hypothetical protein
MQFVQTSVISSVFWVPQTPGSPRGLSRPVKGWLYPYQNLKQVTSSVPTYSDISHKKAAMRSLAPLRSAVLECECRAYITLVLTGLRPVGARSWPGTYHDERIPGSAGVLIHVVQALGSHMHGSTLLDSYTLFPLNNVLITQILWQ